MAGACASISAVLRAFVNRMVWATAIIVMGPLVIVAEKLFPGRGYGAAMTHWAALTVVRLVDVEVDVRGRERLDPNVSYVFAPNHRSDFDILAMLVALPATRFAAKKELFDRPLIGGVVRALGMIPVDRDRPEIAKDALARAAKDVDGGASMIVFPEGEMSTAELFPFKRGAFVLAIQTGAPVVPVALHNTGAIMRPNSRTRINPGWVVVEFLDPVPVDGMTMDERHTLSAKVRSALESSLRHEDGGTAVRNDVGPRG